MRTLMLSFCLLFAVPATHAAAPMTLQTLLAEHVRAIGPVAKVQSRRVRMRVIGMAPFELPVVTEAARPNLLRKEVNIQGNTQITVFDGKQGWKIDPFVPGGATPSQLPPLEAKALAGEADFDGMLVNPAAKGIKLAYAGPAEVDGKPAHAVAVTLPDGGAATIWFDAASYLEIKRTQPALVMGEMKPVDVYSSDYRLVGNLQIPHRIEGGMPGVKERMVIVFDAVELNVKIDPARFVKPAVK